MEKGTKNHPYGSCGECGQKECPSCKFLMSFGKLYYCRWTEPRIGLWEKIRWARSTEEEIKKCAFQFGCGACKWMKRKISCDKCVDCLATKDLVNFEPDSYYLDWEKEHGM